jgi:hypothetical protein
VREILGLLAISILLLMGYGLHATKTPFPLLALSLFRIRTFRAGVWPAGKTRHNFRMAAEKAVEYAGQILSALDAAHRKAITHRDLKPANIMVTKQHGIKLLDFGLARIAASSPDSTLTQPGERMGTPAYMSPEQWDGKPGDARSDIYCFAQRRLSDFIKDRICMTKTEV